MRMAILIFALLATTGARATETTCGLTGQIVSPVTGRCFTPEKDISPPGVYGSDIVPGQVLLDLNQLSQPLMMCYMERFNERRLCALLGDTPGCVKWLTEHPEKEPPQ